MDGSASTIGYSTVGKSAAIVRPLRPVADRPAGEWPSDGRLEDLLRRLCVALEELVALQVANRVSAALRSTIPQAALNTLSPAEHEVLQSVLEGLSNNEIASRRETSIKTVKGQLTGVYKKLNVSGRRKLLSRVALSQGLLTPRQQ